MTPFLLKQMKPSLEHTPQNIFEKRQNQGWIFCESQPQWSDRVNAYLEQLERWKMAHGLPRVMVLMTEPIELLAAYMACAIAQCPVFLGNSDWQQQELAQAKAIANPHIIWSDQDTESFPQPPANPKEAGWIMIPTGGTSGQIKFSIHNWLTLSASVAGMHSFFYPETL